MAHSRSFINIRSYQMQNALQGFAPTNQSLPWIFWLSNVVGSAVPPQQSENVQNLSSSFQSLGRTASPSRPGGLGLPGHLCHFLRRHSPDFSGCIWSWRNPGRLPRGGDLGAELWRISWHSPRVMKGRVLRDQRGRVCGEQAPLWLGYKGGVGRPRCSHGQRRSHQRDLTVETGWLGPGLKTGDGPGGSCRGFNQKAGGG